MDRTQRSIQFTDAMDRQVVDLSRRGFGNRTDVVRIAIDRMWTYEHKEGIMPRRFVGFNQSIRGEYTPEELEAVRQFGAVNAYLRPVIDVVDELNQSAPEGWRVRFSDSTHSYEPAPPNWKDASNEPILLGFVRVIHGDPHFPVWAFLKH